MNPETTKAEFASIEIIGGIAPSGKWIFFRPDADLSHLDDSKVQRFTFEVEPAATKHSVAANGHAYEVLERLGLTPGPDGAVAPGTYSAALRLTTALLRCQRLITPGGDTLCPTVGDMFAVPSAVLQQYQYELGRSDELTRDDLAFFTKAAPEEALPAEDKAETKDAGKTGSGS